MNRIMHWAAQLAVFILLHLDPLVWKAQRFASKVEIGLFLYAVGAILVCGESLFQLLFVGGFYVGLLDLRLLRWAKAHGDEPARGALPQEYGELVAAGIRDLAVVTFYLATFVPVAILLYVVPVPSPAPVAAPSPLVTILFTGFVPPIFFPVGFFGMGLGLLVLACRPRPRSERFSLTRWLQERQTPAPALLRI